MLIDNKKNWKDKVLRWIAEFIITAIPAAWTVWALVLAFDLYEAMQATGEFSWKIGINLIIVLAFDLKFLKTYFRMRSIDD